MPSIADLEKLLAMDPADPFVLYGLAQEHAKAGDTARAVAFYDRCIAADPAYCYAYFHKAKALELAGDIAGARQSLDKGMQEARRCGDGHAAGEMQGYLEELEG